MHKPSLRFQARYWLETPLPIEQAARIIAGEQSSGTFVALANETPELLARSGASIEALTSLEVVDQPSLPGRYGPAQRFHRAELTLSWPMDNIGCSVPNLMATVAGNLYELACVSGLRLQQLNLPLEFASGLPGPAFGIEGTRRLTGVQDRPLIGTIIKPSIGLNPEQTAHEVDQLARAEIDFIKDDELQADGVVCPFEARVQAVMLVLKRAADRLGRLPMYAFNLTGTVDEMKRRHDWVLAQGGTCVMVSLNSVGWAGLEALRRHAVLPIHAHRNGWGYWHRHPGLGWDYEPWQMLMRLGGADHLHVNGLANKFSEPDASVIGSALSVLKPLWAEAPMAAMPVFSSGQTGRVAQATYEALHTNDLIVAAGGGIFGHPSGLKAGVHAMREAWVAAEQGIELHAHAQNHADLATALTFW